MLNRPQRASQNVVSVWRPPPAAVTGVAEAVGLGFASYGAHEAGSNTRSTSEKRFEDTIGRKQS